MTIRWYLGFLFCHSKHTAINNPVANDFSGQISTKRMDGSKGMQNGYGYGK